MRVKLSNTGTRRRPVLYGGASVFALVASGALSPAAAAGAAAMLSPAGLAQAASQRSVPSASTAIRATGVVNPAHQAQAALSAANLARAAQAIKDTTAAQAAARASSQLTLNNVPLSGSSWNGNVLSGLNPVDDADPTKWINADPLQKDTASATATIKQTAANALLTWQSLDLNKGETLVFDQQDHADWTVLNRVVAGPRDQVTGSRFVASPSMILGKIKAAGNVYVINPNGIIFGPTAEIDVHSLIASSLDVGNPIMTQGQRDAFFLNTGILGNGTDVPAASFSYDPRDTVVEGDVRVEAGAVITTSLAPRSVSPDAGGFVYLLAPNVENHGTISTPAGETMMVAAQFVRLIANAYPDGGIDEDSEQNVAQTFRAVGVDTAEIAWRLDGPASAHIAAPGAVINTGLIDARRGVAILNGDLVTNTTAGGAGGIIRADTSVTRNGQVFLNARIQLTLGEDSFIQILPDSNGETIPLSAIANFQPGSVVMSGNTISLESGALVIAPGANVSVSSTGNVLGGLYPEEIRPLLPQAAQRIHMAPDAQIDVSGLNGVTLPMSANLITVKPFGNEFADQPLQRQGALRGVDLTIDIRESGTLEGIPWVGTPIANVGGFINNIQRTVDWLLTTGGTVSLSAPATGEIILRQGSAINVGGGSVHYEGGVVGTSKLLTVDGRVVDIARAHPLDAYVGIAGVTTELHPKWGSTTTQIFESSIFANTQFEPGYTEGHDAGGITFDANAYVLEGTLHGATIAGDRQRMLGIRPSAETANTNKANPYALPSSGYFAASGRNNLIIEAATNPLPGGFALADPLTEDRVQNARFSASQLSDAGFGRISANFSGHLTVTRDAVLQVDNGGTIDLAGGSATIAGHLIARSGKISVTSTAHVAGDQLDVPVSNYQPDLRADNSFDLVIESTARLDASGLWVNDTDAEFADLIGSAHIDGGTITLKTITRSAECISDRCSNLPRLGEGVPAILDLTGDIVLSEGSVLDVSSGGRVTREGQMQLDSGGRPAGRGGNIGLATYATPFSTVTPGPFPPTIDPLSATIRLSGSDRTPEGNAVALNEVISARGLAEGGTLSLQTPGIAIEDERSTKARGVFSLSPEFFDGNAFGTYKLSSVAGHLTIAPSAAITLRQQNFVAEDALLALQSGAKLADAAGVGLAPDILRSPVNLSLSALLAPLPDTPYDPLERSPVAHVALRIREDTIIEGDPAATIRIEVTGRPFWLGSSTGATGLPPPVAQQIGVAEILGTIRAPGGSITILGGLNSTIWLGADSMLDAGGILIADTRQPLFRSGTILPGGKVTIATSADVNAAIVALSGALIDVSGPAGEFDILQDGAFGLERVATPVWSDAGSIAITATTLLFDGGFLATPGSSEANGGRLTIAIPEGGGRSREVLTVRQSGTVVPEGLAPRDSLDPPEPPPPEEAPPEGETPDEPPVPLRGSVYFKADSLNGSGIADLVLSASPIEGDILAASANAFAPGRIVFDGDVTISGLNSLAMDASGVSVINITDTGVCNVCLDARYVALRGSGTVAQFLPEPGFGRLRVAGETIDIAAGGLSAGIVGFDTSGLLSLSGFGHARFISSGDIRFRVPIANVTRDLVPGTLPSGQLLTRADLTFLAEQIYPVSSIDFTVKSTGPEATISFGQTGVPESAPLSAGGRLTVSAAHIEQGGRLLAPLGVIRLGAQSAEELSSNDPIRTRMVPTQSVTFAPGSITSVSLNGLTVPFGVTANETSWSYNSNFGRPLTAPPAKDIVVSGTEIDLAEGATLDISGGGVIQAMEFVPGIGGTRDVLATGGEVYAIIPGYNPAAAPIDLEFIVQQRDGLPAAGRSVFLSGGDGLPAGMYTLLPSHYATLPGAYRVSLVAGSLDALSSLNTVRPDGTMRMTGYFARQAAGTRDPRAQFFDVQSSAVWRQYSEITHISGTTFFGDETVGETGRAPRLPIDAGHAAFSAVTGLSLDGLIKAAAAASGRGGQLDIAARDIEILPPGGAITHVGLLPLDATQLSGLGVESLLIGGMRTQDADGGDRITVVANAVRVHNNADAPLEAPEIILVTKPGSGAEDPNAAFDVRLDADSVVRAVGEVADPVPRVVTIGDDELGIPGSGSLLAVSNGAPLTVIRENAKQANGEITVVGPDAKPGAPGATLEGASLTLDTTGQIRLNTGVTVTGNDISIAAKSISFGEVTDAPGGFIVRGDILKQLEHAETLTLRAASQSINFYGGINIGLEQPGSHLVLDAQALVATAPGFVKLTAGTVSLINTGEASDPLLPGEAALRVEAEQIELGGGDKALGGFAFATFAASAEVSARDTGSLDAGNADLRFVSPLFLVGAGADQSILTSNLVTFAGADTPGLPTTAAEIGGTLTVRGASVDLAANALIQASAGGVALEATTGDIHLGDNARILANGYVQTFFDVTRVTGGGSVALTADLGSIRAHAASSIDVSSPVGYTGFAGSIALNTPNGWIFTDSGAFDMNVIAGSVDGDTGGRVTIHARHLGDPLAPLSIPTLFSDSVNIRVSRGDLSLAADLVASNVTLTADQGTITVDHTIDASGKKGGTISLFGGQGVVLAETGQLLATASDGEKRGGDIILGTQVATANGSDLTGVIDLQGGVIDVSNTVNPAQGGAIVLRAPLIGEGPFGDDVAINTIGSEIRGATSVTVEAFKVFDTANSAFNGVIDPIAQPDFYGSCTSMGVCSGTLVEFVQGFALSADAQAKFASIDPKILHLQPGIELVNNDPSINNGGITVATAWNLGAGFAGYLVSAREYVRKDFPTVPAGLVITDAYGNLLPEYAHYQDDLLFVPGISQITSLVYRVGGEVTGEPGALTLRAIGDVAINDSITDGFFNTRNVFDDDYQFDLFSWILRSLETTNTTNVGGYTIAGATFNTPVGFQGGPSPGPAPMAPFDLQANVISPIFSAQGKTPITSADLFPLIADPEGPIEGYDGNYRAVGSWSYRIAGGADVASANPLALQPLAAFADNNGTALAGRGNVVLDGHKQYNVVDYLAGVLMPYRMPTIVRTGTGSIDIAAAPDFVLADKSAPGVVYTAGRNAAELPDPGFEMQTVADPINPGRQIAVPVATDPEGFLKPYALSCDINVGCYAYGPLTLSAYPVDGGHLTLTAQRDIVGYEHPVIFSGGEQHPLHQYFAPWLLARGTALPVFDFGPFSALSAYLSTAGDAVFSPAQTSWWINFGSFGQGVMSVGGDVRIEAGRDIQELSVSLPTTARVSGGLSGTITDPDGNEVANIPVMHLNGSGDLTVIAGRDLKSGAYYEGSGHAEIEVGGSVSASWTLRDESNPISTVLALDTGTITLTARRSADIAGVVSGPSLQNVADQSGILGNILSQHLSSYGPSSKVTLQSIAGDAIANSLAVGTDLVANPAQGNIAETILYPGINRYPANLEMVAFRGNVVVADRLRLAASDAGTLNLLAYDSLLTRTPAGAEVLPMSTGPSLVEAVFDPLNPLAGFGPEPGSPSFDLGARLLHVNDPEPARFYAATGDIISGPGAVGQAAFMRPLAWEVSKPAKVQAAGDIVDLSFFGQNLEPTDVTEIVAGRDLRYTGTWQNLIGQITGELGQAENQGGLGLAGPGFFVVQAGRDLGPFVTAAADVAANNLTSGTDSTGTGIISFGNLAVAGNRRMLSDHDGAVTDRFALGLNDKLPHQGADIITLFGVANGVDYQAVVRAYIDPATSTSPRNYLPDLVVYLQSLGLPAQTTGEAWATFQSLPEQLRNVFVHKVFFSELRIPGDAEGCCFKQFSIGYSMANTLFPASLGYTDNGPDETAAPKQRETGDLDLLHATIKTLQSGTLRVLKSDGKPVDITVGGSIMLLGPGGTINVGTTAVEINKHLTNSAVGILTLNNGTISTFTDESVLVNQSRILTVQGGDILMWSSNRNLDAGRGAKTTVDFKPLSVDFAPNDLQTINLNGLVSGAGIGTIKSTPDAPSASAYLIAPRGIVNAGDAGLRSSGNLSIAALLVLNAANIASVGAVAGVPDVGAVNLGALESTAAVGGQAAQAAQEAVAEAANRGAQVAPPVIPSLITVEVFIGTDPDMDAPVQ